MGQVHFIGAENMIRDQWECVLIKQRKDIPLQNPRGMHFKARMPSKSSSLSKFLIITINHKNVTPVLTFGKI